MERICGVAAFLTVAAIVARRTGLALLAAAGLTVFTATSLIEYREADLAYGAYVSVVLAAAVVTLAAVDHAGSVRAFVNRIPSWMRLDRL